MLVVLISALLLVLILTRTPVAFAILLSGIIGLLVVGGPSLVLTSLETLPVSAIGKNSLAAIPLFILMAQFILKSGFLADLFDSAQKVVGKVPGGTAIAAIGAGAVFASVSGSSTAAAATLAHTSTEQLIRQGYSKPVSTGAVAAAGTLAAMIPPSVLLVFYAITADTPVGATLIAGIIPGLLVAVALCATVIINLAIRKETIPPGVTANVSDRALALVKVLPMLALFVIVVGMVFLGITTATEAAAVGAMLAFVLMAIRREATWANLVTSLKETISSTAMILCIVFAAHIFSHFIVETHTTNAVVTYLSSLQMPPLLVVGIIALGYLVLGFFMDQMAIIALTVPVTLPVVEAFGFDPIWFGILVILLAEVGLITPPLGLNVFVVARAAKLPVETIFLGAAPFAVAILIVGIILFLFPSITLLLPNFMN
ncbi:TRAP transporter large permease [Brevibacterium paucivorans]|uniref:TRAP transporter large permease n=1 Tax=Brevibacterium paucivorans TaxID=170994 RepID=UPI00321A722C